MVSADTTGLCVAATDSTKPMGLWLCSNKTLLKRAAGHIWLRGLHVLTSALKGTLLDHFDDKYVPWPPSA